MNLLPAQFYRLTPREFRLIWDGWIVRQKDQEENQAWALANIINYCSMGLKQPVTIESILGRPLRANMDDALAKKDRARRQAAEGR